jgi:hypothetical protein
MSLFGQVHTANILKLVPAFSCHKFYHCRGAHMFFFFFTRGQNILLYCSHILRERGRKTEGELYKAAKGEEKLKENTCIS